MGIKSYSRNNIKLQQIKLLKGGRKARHIQISNARNAFTPSGNWNMLEKVNSFFFAENLELDEFPDYDNKLSKAQWEQIIFPMMALSPSNQELFFSGLALCTDPKSYPDDVDDFWDTLSLSPNLRQLLEDNKIIVKSKATKQYEFKTPLAQNVADILRESMFKNNIPYDLAPRIVKGSYSNLFKTVRPLHFTYKKSEILTDAVSNIQGTNFQCLTIDYSVEKFVAPPTNSSSVVLPLNMTSLSAPPQQTSEEYEFIPAPDFLQKKCESIILGALKADCQTFPLIYDRGSKKMVFYAIKDDKHYLFNIDNQVYQQLKLNYGNNMQLVLNSETLSEDSPLALGCACKGDLKAIISASSPISFNNPSAKELLTAVKFYNKEGFLTI